MTVIAIGTDIVAVARIEDALTNNGDKFLLRVLNENEISQLPESEAMKVSFVSKRWAAKEAVAKAFGTGIGAELSFLDMEISHQQSGKPIVELNSRAQKLAQKKGISKFHLSISDEKNYAVAFVVASAD